MCLASELLKVSLNLRLWAECTLQFWLFPCGTHGLAVAVAFAMAVGVGVGLGVGVAAGLMFLAVCMAIISLCDKAVFQIAAC